MADGEEVAGRPW